MIVSPGKKIINPWHSVKRDFTVWFRLSITRYCVLSVIRQGLKEFTESLVENMEPPFWHGDLIDRKVNLSHFTNYLLILQNTLTNHSIPSASVFLACLFVCLCATILILKLMNLLEILWKPSSSPKEFFFKKQILNVIHIYIMYILYKKIVYIFFAQNLNS